MDSSKLHYLLDLGGRAALIALYGMFGTSKSLAMWSALRQPQFDKLNFFSHGASLAFVTLVLWMTVTRLPLQSSSQGWEPRLTALAGTLVPLLLLALPFTETSPTIRVIGLLVIAIGWTLSVFVLAWLGRSFSVMPQARQLVTSGPYGIVRHPLYLTEEIAFLGLVILNLSPSAMIIAILHWPLQLRRMINEETVLRAAFPAYADYALHTPRIVPRFILLRSRKLKQLWNRWFSHTKSH